MNILIKYLIRYKRLFLLGLLVLVIVDILELLSPLYIRGAIDDLVAGEFNKKWAIYYLLTALGSGLCRYAWRVFLIRGSMLSGRDLRQEYSEYLFKLSARFFDKNKVGDLMSLATNDIESVRMALGPGLLMSADAVFYLITVPCAMFLLSWKLSLIVLIPIVFVPWFVYRNEKAVKARYQKVQETFSDISALSQESLSGIRVIKGFAKEKIQTQRLKNLSQTYRTQSLDLSKVQTTFGPKLDLLTSLGWVLLLAAGGAMVLNGSLSIGTFVAFQRYIEKLIWPMVALSFAIIHYQRAIGSVERLNKVFDVQPDAVQNAVQPAHFQTQSSSVVEFKNLHFKYDSADSFQLKDISFKVEKNQRVALIGKIGSGKSTLLSLIPRLYVPEPGQLFLLSKDSHHWDLQELRKHIGYVSQEIFLMSDTIESNVSLGIQENSLDEEKTTQIIHSLQSAQLFDEIQSLPEALRTLLGERGLNLSGGQRQRLTIARALSRKPQLLILDDALSSVDVKTEQLINQRLHDQKMTQLLAAHRISTIKESDWIVVLDSGTVSEQGTHVQLLKQQGLYYQFYEQQKYQEEVNAELENYIKQKDLT